MPICKCGFSKGFPMCDGTHKTVSAVRSKISADIIAECNHEECNCKEIADKVSKL